MQNLRALFILLAIILLLSGCATPRPDGAPKGHLDVSRIPDAVPKAEPLCKYGNPHYYWVHGKKQYVLKSAKGYSKVGFASWYGTKFNGQLTSSRERYDLYGMTAASRELPIPTYVQVTNLENHKSVIVRVNDRGPFVGNRIMDLSYAAAKKLGYANKGTTLVRVTAIDPYLWAKNKTAQPLVPQPAGLPDTFYVQVGAFSNPQNADSYRYRIAQLTRATVRVKYTSRINGTPLYRVQVGPLNAAQSNQLREALEQHALAPAMRVTT